MKIQAKLSIGFPGAMQFEELEVDDSKLEGLSKEAREDYLNKIVDEWAAEFIETWYEE